QSGRAVAPGGAFTRQPALAALESNGSAGTAAAGAGIAALGNLDRGRVDRNRRAYLYCPELDSDLLRQLLQAKPAEVKKAPEPEGWRLCLRSANRSKN